MIEQDGSFLDDMPQHILDAEILEISEMLFDEWMDSNLNDGQFWADRRFAEMSNSEYTKQAFNTFYGLTEDDEEYIEC
jgi:hypothetical protein